MAHDLFETRVDDVHLGSALQVCVRAEAHDFKELLLRSFLVFLSQLARGNVVDVFKPFEVGASDATAVDEHVRGVNDALLDEDLLSGVGCGTVGTLENGAHLDLICVHLVKRLFRGSRNQAVSLLLHERCGFLELGFHGARVSFQGLVLSQVGLDIVGVEALGVVNSRVVLDDSRDLASVLVDEVRGPVAHGTEALDDEGLVVDSKLLEADLVAEGLKAEQLASGVENTKASRLSSAGNTTLADKLARAAALSVDVLLTFNVHVGILDPRHHLLVGAHVRPEAVDGCADEALFNQLDRVFSCSAFKLGLAVQAGINLNSALGTAEGDVGESQLERHQGG